jgi:creatinine amidohydrolase
MTHFAAALSWPRVKALADTGAIALLPVGSTEAHGPHLPLSVDVVIAEEVCRRLARRLEPRSTVIFPAVAYGLTDFAAAFAGTVSLSADATRAMLSGVLEGIARHGFTRVGVINHHIEPAHFAVVHEAAKLAQSRVASTTRIVVPDHRRRPHGPRLGDEFMHGGSHAGRYETALMLAAAPQLVDEPARRALPELRVDLPAKIKAGAKTFHEAGGPDAYFGAPAAATAAEGHQLLDILAEISEAALKEDAT